VLRAYTTAETRSHLEEAFLKLCDDHDLPRPSTNTVIEGILCDFVWPTQRLIVEVDGYTYHSHPAAFERDRRRDQQLIAAGYRVIRITWIQLRDRPIETIASIIQALAYH